MPSTPVTLGLTLQLAPLSVSHNIWHIVAVPSPRSPAHLAGLLPHSDYIVGSPSGTLSGETALGEIVEDHLNRTLVLWVYNSEFDVVREVELIPHRGWGGEGALGAVLGFGALHRLPVALSEEMQAPGEQLFEARSVGDGAAPLTKTTETSSATQPQSPSFFYQNSANPMPFQATNTLADKTTPATGAGKGGKPASRSKKGPSHNLASSKTAFDDMFEEGAKQSQEQDYIPASRKATSVPPPPKVNAVAEAPGIGPSASPSPAPGPGPGPIDDTGQPGEAEPA